MTSPDQSLVGVQSAPVPVERPLRADARRNRERLLAAARAAFTASEDTVVIEDIARDAGVGIGTLYRHFPTREVLVEAVYASELDQLTESAAVLLAELAPDVALRAWVDRYAQFVVTKRGMIDTLRAGWASGRLTTPATRERLTSAIRTIMEAGAREGLLRADAEPEDVIAMLLGVFMTTARNNATGQAGRLLDLVVDGLRAQAPR